MDDQKTLGEKWEQDEFKGTFKRKENKPMTRAEKKERKAKLEEKVRAMLSAGYFTHEIAEALDITEATVISIRGDRKC